MGHCYRCVYTWRMRRRVPTMCPRCKSRLYDIPKIHPVAEGQGLGIGEILAPHRSEILRISRKFGANKVWVFGSVRRREAVQGSDVDLMVTWVGPHSLLQRVALQQSLESVIGRPVDLVNRGGLHWSIEPQVEAEAVPL